jgi:glycerophosphoryl diester phosphodiesterase
MAVQIYGHRGAWGLAPENTLHSFYKAITLGVDVIDMDLQMTKDGILVAQHDYTLNPQLTRNAKGDFISSPAPLIKALTFQQLQQYNIGALKPGSKQAKLFPEQVTLDKQAIPSLKQAVDFIRQHAANSIRFQFEIKTEPDHPEWTFSPEVLAKAVADFLAAENLIEIAEVQSFDFRILLALQRLNPKIQTAYLTADKYYGDMRSADPQRAGKWSAGYLLKDYDYSVPKMIAHLGGKIWGPEDIELTAELVQEAQSLGLKVVPWRWSERHGVVFDHKLIQALLDYGVDGIITDRPDLLGKILLERKRKH